MPDEIVPGPETATPADAHAPGDLPFRSLFEYAPVEVHIWALVRDESGLIVTWRLVDANPIALKAWGRRREDVVGKTTDEIFPGGDAVRTFLPTIKEIMVSGKPKQWEVPFSGTAQVLRMASIPVGECFISTGFDVTHEQTRLLQLEQELQSVKQATEAGGVGLWDWDMRTNEVRYSDEWKRQLGHASDEVGNSFEEWRSRVHPDDLEQALTRVQATIEDPRRLYDAVVRLRHKDGSYRSILGQGSVLRDEAGRPQRMIGSQVDITERRRLEERELEAQKLESLGTLAAGIAHDFNNILGIILGNAKLAAVDAELNTAVQLSLDEIKKAGVRGRDVVQQILAFSRKQPTLRQTLHPKELVAETTRLLRPLLPAQVALVVDSQENMPSIDADRIQIDQVLMNLVTNAAHAMGSKAGEIRISVRGCQASLSEGGTSDAGERPCVLISVTDNGAGMDAETQERLFEPFFTTKPLGEGTGLGLSVVQNIVKGHGGRIVVDSTLGVGTRFDLYFPVAQAKDLSTPAVTTTTTTPTLEHKGRVLYIDDDEALVFLMERLLRQSGHEVKAFNCAEEALSLLRTTDQHFDVVVSDYNMPGANGIDVLREVASLRPGTPAALISGYITDAMREEAAKVKVTEIVFKPDSAQELVEAINRMLGGT